MSSRHTCRHVTHVVTSCECTAHTVYDSIAIYASNTAYSSTWDLSETHHTCRHVTCTRPSTVRYCVFIHIWRANVSTSLYYYSVLLLIYFTYIFVCIHSMMARKRWCRAHIPMSHALYVYSSRCKIWRQMCIHSMMARERWCRAHIPMSHALYVCSSTCRIWRQMCIHSHVCRAICVARRFVQGLHPYVTHIYEAPHMSVSHVTSHIWMSHVTSQFVTSREHSQLQCITVYLFTYGAKDMWTYGAQCTSYRDICRFK